MKKYRMFKYSVHMKKFRRYYYALTYIILFIMVILLPITYRVYGISIDLFLNVIALFLLIYSITIINIYNNIYNYFSEYFNIEEEIKKLVEENKD